MGCLHSDMKNPIPEIRYFDYVPDPIILQHILPEISDPQDFKDLISVSKRFRYLVRIFMSSKNITFLGKIPFKGMEIRDVERELIRSAGIRSRKVYIYWKAIVPNIRNFQRTHITRGKYFNQKRTYKALELNQDSNPRVPVYMISFVFHKSIIHVMLRQYDSFKNLGIVCPKSGFGNCIDGYRYGNIFSLNIEKRDSLIENADKIMQHHQECWECFKMRSQFLVIYY